MSCNVMLCPSSRVAAFKSNQSNHKPVLKVGYGICETPAEFENKQLKWSYPLSFNADSDSTHSKYLNAQSCTSARTQMRESEPG
ncbi:unnamed protein product [Boreogadus saida]